jgi:AcrR family transcriptional regulator
MPKDKTENHEKIISSARKEFMTYSFKDASMRRIAADSGMSVSGLYKHFPSKEDMFAALVEPAYQGLVEMYRQSADDMHRILSTSDLSNVWETSNETAWIMKYIYENYDAFKLIVCNAEGIRYENFLHDAARLGEESTLAFMEQFRSKGKKLNDFSMKEFHLLTTTYIDAVFQAVRHDLTRDEALHYADTLDKFFTLSWKNFFGY